MIIEILDRKKSIIYDATEDFISIDWSFDDRNDKNIVTLKMNVTNDVLKNISNARCNFFYLYIM